MREADLWRRDAEILLQADVSDASWEINFIETLYNSAGTVFACKASDVENDKFHVGTTEFRQVDKMTVEATQLCHCQSPVMVQ